MNREGEREKRWTKPICSLECTEKVWNLCETLQEASTNILKQKEYAHDCKCVHWWILNELHVVFDVKRSLMKINNYSNPTFRKKLSPVIPNPIAEQWSLVIRCRYKINFSNKMIHLYWETKDSIISSLFYIRGWSYYQMDCQGRSITHILRMNYNFLLCWDSIP